MFQFDLLTMKTELLSQIKLECKCTLFIHVFGNDRNKKFLERVPKLSLIYIMYGSFSLLYLLDCTVHLYMAHNNQASTSPRLPLPLPVIAWR